MKSPKDMRIIQIDITNACIHKCSNCTRFCGHHKNPFFMDFSTFKRAVDSLDGYEGTVGIMGGEPTLHPDIEHMIHYLASKYPKKEYNRFIRPQTNFMEGIRDLEMAYTHRFEHDGITEGRIKGIGLWSALGKGYKDHYEVIQDYVSYQVLNDHTNEIFHQPALITRKELGISDEKWFNIRNNCWVQNFWSATITPKGAFFCEVAGALDMLFNGPGGWEIEPGWWKRTPEDFKEQLHWCEYCSLALEIFARDARDEIDDVSPVMADKLSAIESPKLKQNKVNILQIEDGKISESCKPKGKIYGGGLTYAENYFSKMNLEKNNLQYKRILFVANCKTKEDIKAAIKSADQFIEVFLFLSDGVRTEQTLPENVRLIKEEGHTIGYFLYMILREFSKSHDFIFYADSGIEVKKFLTEQMKVLTVNPGTLHVAELNSQSENEYFRIRDGSEGFAVLFGSAAHTIRDLGYDRLLHMHSISELIQKWDKNKIVELCPNMMRIAPSSKIEPRIRYVVYGAGSISGSSVDRIRAAGGIVAAIVDKAAEVHPKEIRGIAVQPPQFLLNHKDKFDRILIASIYSYQSIKDDVEKMGFEESVLLLP